MAFRVPSFPLKCRIWHDRGGSNLPPTETPDATEVPCQLRPTISGSQVSGSLTNFLTTVLLLPALTDIRPAHPGKLTDLVECPAASGLFHVVIGVLDRAKGFANEHRMAVIEPLTSTPGGWIFPTP